LSFVPKRFKPEPGQPFLMSIPLSTIDETDNKLMDFLDAYRKEVCDYLFSLDETERARIFGKYEVTPEWFADPDFWKGPLGFWQSNVDLKARFEFGFDKKPKYILVDLSQPDSPRMMQPDHVEKSNGVAGTFTISNFYILEGKVKVKNLEGGEDEEINKISCGSTLACTGVKRITSVQMEEINPSENIDNSAEIEEIRTNESWKQMEGFRLVPSVKK
jgi:hypothetical protein